MATPRRALGRCHHITALDVAAATLVVSRHDAAAHREHVGLPLAISRRRLAINDDAAAHATLPHRLHTYVLALAPKHVSPW